MRIAPAHRIDAPRDSRAFTLVELLAVIGVLILLGGLIAPAFAKARPASDLVTCQDNLRRIGQGFSLYSKDYRDEICRTAGLDTLVDTTRPNKNYGPNQQWCMGTMHQAPSWTNTALIQDSLLYPYVRSLSAYRCPADVSGTKSTSGAGDAKVRSISANCFLNPANPWGSGRAFRKLGDLVLGPSMTWVAMEENPISINDGWLIHPQSSGGVPGWVDYPGSFHRDSGNLVFADDHVEARLWTDRQVLDYGRNLPGPTANRSADYRWLEERTTVR